MISQKTNYPGTPQVDYSSVRMDVENQNRGLAAGIDDVTDDKVTFSSHKNQVVEGNQNLSSVLSQIQDDGPACSGSVKRDNLINLRTNKKNPHADQLKTDLEKQYYSQPGPDFERQKINNTSDYAATRAVTPVPSSVTMKYTAGLLLTLFITVMLAVVFYLYRLDTRAEQLVQSLNVKQANINNAIATDTNELSVDAVNANKLFLDELNVPEHIQEKNLAINNNEAIVAPDLTLSTKSIKENNNISVLQEEIVSLRNELTASNKKLVAKDKDAVKKEKPKQEFKEDVSERGNEQVAATKKMVKNTVVNAWIVNLASFTDKGRADKAAANILPSGFEPSIESATVNGKKVFRLIVSGFYDRDDAEAFVGLADDLFSLKGGWIRQVNINK